MVALNYVAFLQDPFVQWAIGVAALAALMLLWCQRA